MKRAISWTIACAALVTVGVGCSPSRSGAAEPLGHDPVERLIFDPPFEQEDDEEALPTKVLMHPLPTDEGVVSARTLLRPLPDDASP